MGPFAGIKRIIKMSQAAAVVQAVLEQVCRTGVMQGDPQKMATHLVGLCWKTHPDVFDGKFGKPPHRLATAAVALAAGFEEYREQPSLTATVGVALGEILKEVEIRGSLYPFHDLDMEMFRRATVAFFKEDEKRQSRIGPQ